jgi:hypothetical protein
MGVRIIGVGTSESLSSLVSRAIFLFSLEWREIHAWVLISVEFWVGVA